MILHLWKVHLNLSRRNSRAPPALVHSTYFLALMLESGACVLMGGRSPLMEVWGGRATLTSVAHLLVPVRLAASEWVVVAPFVWHRLEHQPHDRT